MNRLAKTLSLFLIALVLGGAGGDNVRNGAGWVEYQILETWQNMPSILKPCLIEQCALSEEQVVLVANAADDTRLWKQVAPVFLAGSKTRARFPRFPGGEVGLIGIERASRGDSERFVIDQERLYAETPEGALKTPTALAIARDLLAIALIHAGSPEDFATRLSERAAKALFPPGHASARFMSFAKYGEPHSGLLLTKFENVGLAVSDDPGTHRLDSLVVAALKCRGSATAIAVRDLDQAYWDEPKAEKLRVLFTLRGRIEYSCSNGETLRAQIRIGLRFDLNEEDIERLLSGFGVLGELKWRPDFTVVDLYQIH